MMLIKYRSKKDSFQQQKQFQLSNQNLPQPETSRRSSSRKPPSLRRKLSWPDSVALINSATEDQLLYSDFLRWTNTLAANLRTLLGLCKGGIAFVLSLKSIRVPIIYFVLLTLSVVVSLANPISTVSKIARLTSSASWSSTARKLSEIRHICIKNIVIIDSVEFESMMMTRNAEIDSTEEEVKVIKQSDVVMIIYSSGTTRKVKGVMTTHRNLIAMVAGHNSNWAERESPAVVLYTVLHFHMHGFFYCAKSVVAGEASVVVEGRFGMERMLRGVEEFKVNNLALVPPMVVATVKGDLSAAYDLSFLESIVCGGALLSKDVIAAFNAKFPKILLLQDYGTTEATMAIYQTVYAEKIQRWGSLGRLIEYLEAKNCGS